MVDKDKLRLLKQEWVKNNLEKVRKSKREWNYRNRGLRYELQKGYIKRHPEIIKAHQFIRNNNIKLDRECNFCKGKNRLEGHHPDYANPGYILTVCHLCHSKIHYIGKRVN